MEKIDIIKEQKSEIDQLTKELELLRGVMDDAGKRVTVIVPAPKLTYKKWVKLGEKKYFERFFPSQEEITEIFRQGLH